MENKKTKKASILKGAILTGVIAGLTPLSVNSSALFTYDVLGSGAEVRTQILEEKTSDGTVYELKCGTEKKEDPKKKGETEKSEATKAEKKGKSTEAKCGEGKCGEGKCGAEKKEGKTEKSTESEKGKSTEAKCGEGKCGVE